MLSQGNREMASLEPAPSDETLLPPALGGSPGNSLPLERFVWFTDAAAAGVVAPEINNIFYNRNAAPLVEPGQYAVVGPRATTYLGSQDENNDNPDSMITHWGGNSQQSITITPTTLVVTDTAGTTTSPNYGVAVRNIVGIIADHPTTPTNASSGAWSEPWTVGMNITEPLPNPNVYAPTANYYREPTAMIMAPGADRSFYDDPDAPLNDGTGFKDEPEEAASNANGPGRPIFDRDMQQTGTYLECSSVFLQRLANPNLAYNPAPGTNRYNAAPSTDPYVAYNPNLPVNPYITVDWSALDATVFTGEENTSQTTPDPFDPDDPTAGRPNGGRPTLPRQRGYQPTAGTPDANFWDPDAITPGNMPIAGTTSPYFRFDLAAPAPPSNGQTLGFLNATVGTPLGAPYLGESDLSNPPAPGTRQTSPWLAWHNRPFANAMELLMVPSSSPSRICSELTPGPLNAFNVPGAGGIYDGGDAASLRAPFGHLLNLFHSADQVGASADDAMQLCRLLDYVEVPSPYLGAERWFTPAHFTASGTYRPPFSKASRFRDPGRVNINTIFDQRVFQACAGGAPIPGFPMLADHANAALMSRQGYGNAFLVPDVNYPTRFANPFRSADASDLLPNVPLGPGSMQKNRPVDATLLRPEPTVADAAIFGDEPLFAMDWTVAADAHHNTDRNPYFRYQGLQKIGNTFSTTSNVFAVWMTMGYFEVEPAARDNNNDGDTADAGETWATMTAEQRTAWPDGYMLGQEVGVDSGEVVRHRAFYIIDRSVPVGFQPGQKLNTDDCILLRRLIE